MVLLYSVIIGIGAGWVRAKINKRKLRIISFKWELLVVVSVIPQYFLFYSHETSKYFSDSQAAILLIISQSLLIVFIVINRSESGFPYLGLGLILNFIVIVFNQGFMPISPEVVNLLYPNASQGAWVIGSRLGSGKDIVLLIENTNLWLLSDRFYFSGWFNYKVAYSLGDIFLFFGAILFFWSLGSENSNEIELA